MAALDAAIHAMRTGAFFAKRMMITRDVGAS
jgi:hypothetical protein